MQEQHDGGGGLAARIKLCLRHHPGEIIRRRFRVPASTSLSSLVARIEELGRLPPGSVVLGLQSDHPGPLIPGQQLTETDLTAFLSLHARSGRVLRLQGTTREVGCQQEGATLQYKPRVDSTVNIPPLGELCTRPRQSSEVEVRQMCCE